MLVKTHNTNYIDIVGTNKIGTVVTNIDNIINLFGEPLEGNMHEVRCEWHISINDEIVTIYDWCESDKNLDDVKYWSVGATNRKMLYLINELLNYDKHI